MSNAAKEVVVVSGVRTAIGDFGGSLKDFSPTDLGAKVVAEVLSRANVSGDAVGMRAGHVVNTEPKDMYLRVAVINGGVAQHTPAMNRQWFGRSCRPRNDHARRRRHRDRWRLGKHEPRPVHVPAARFGQRMVTASSARCDPVPDDPHGA